MSLEIPLGEQAHLKEFFELAEQHFKDDRLKSYEKLMNGYDDFAYYLNNLETSEPKDGLVPDSTFFCLDVERNIIVGAVNIRHYLNEHLLAHGGHIGDGIRPSERRKGYATQMIGLALDECKKLGIKKVLMVCDKENVGSVKSITNNGGILETEQMENGKTEQRYWIDLE